jgi:predicted adenylyl cyclase CyaB
MQNIEIKVRVPDLGEVRHRLHQARMQVQWEQIQIDTYFRVQHGRLKLREDDSTSLIAYSRPDEDASRISHYRLLPVSDAETLKVMLSEALGVLVTVRKTRSLYLTGHTRIHLDEVDGLGSFVELETVIDDQPLDAAWAEHYRVRDMLALNQHEVVPFSYSDLIMGHGPY